jgi:hypothetical protein
LDTKSDAKRSRKVRTLTAANRHDRQSRQGRPAWTTAILFRSLRQKKAQRGLRQIGGAGEKHRVPRQIDSAATGREKGQRGLR